ncbi:MAG: T9SS type A sorting domain-containing protein [Bacteroidetes bacterium]|nr:T9SS type A sorting domain-containing protein [Bacteroidota bacterium]
MKYLFTIFLLFSFTTFAQIEITNSDINAQYTVGNTTTIRTDTIVTSVDIGQLGTTSWDFSFLIPNPTYDIVIIVVDPNSTPYIGNFPGSNIATKSQFDFMGIMADIYSYLSVNGSFNFHGTVMEADTMLVTNTSNPIEPLGTSPFTFGSTIDYTGERTTVMEINGVPIFTSITTVVSSSVVDAYGPMTLPGGRVVDALRIKEDEINILQGPFPIYSRHVSYTFLAKDGSQVNVPSDTTQSETGVINNTASVSWNDALVTSVRIDEPMPGDYTLKQNYPNPFNPSTNIEYSIPSESFVELKVYDILGNEVATLVNEQQQAGVYRADFTADNLPSGMYFARLTANEFTQVVKMTLLK